MVVAPLACAFNVTSGLIVNGICSYYESMEEERRMKEQEEALRRSIRLELERNRDEEEQRQKRKRDDDESEIFELCLRAERRRKLIARRIIASHRNSTENKGEILQSDSLVDRLEEEESEEEGAEEEKIERKDDDKIPETVQLNPIDQKKTMSSENESSIFRANSLTDGFEKVDHEDKAETNIPVGTDSNEEVCSLVTVTLDSIAEDDDASSEFLSLDSIAL